MQANVLMRCRLLQSASVLGEWQAATELFMAIIVGRQRRLGFQCGFRAPKTPTLKHIRNVNSCADTNVSIYGRQNAQKVVAKYVL